MSDSVVDKPSLPLPRLLRAVLVLPGFVISLYLLGIILGTVTFGGWAEEVFRLVGVNRVGWLSTIAGVLLLAALAIALPAWGGSALIGWPGLIVGPLVAMLALSQIGKW